MRLLGTVAALLLALLAHTALTRVAPAPARLFDPFLVILVFCGLAGGEVHGMLAGAAGGWILDANFWGAGVGVAGLSDLVVGFFLSLWQGPRYLSEHCPPRSRCGLTPREIVVLASGSTIHYDNNC